MPYFGSAGILPALRILLLPESRSLHPRPVLQSRILRIQEHVLDDLTEFPFVSNQVVVVFALPKGAGACQQLIRSLRRVRLPRVENSGKSVIWERLKNGMNVVRHHAPGEEPIPHTTEMTHGFSHSARDSRFRKEARTRPRIQVGFDFFAEKFGKAFSLVGREVAVLRVCGRHDIPPLELVCFHDRFGQRVREAKCDKVDASVGLPVRKSAPVAHHYHAFNSKTK